MNLGMITRFINDRLNGELLSTDELLVHLDSVVDDINANLNTKFPAFSEFTPDKYEQYPNYNFFPDKYIRSVVCAGAAFKFFTTDEEGIATATTYQYDYDNALFVMLRDYSNLVPEEYKEDEQGFIKYDGLYEGYSDNGGWL